MVATVIVVVVAIILAVTYRDAISGIWSVTGQDTITVFVGGTSFSVSIADTQEERRQGLSGTDALAEFTGKLFIFDTVDTHGIWMKDMNYAIDILWFDNSRQLIHIEEKVTPETYTLNRTIFRPDQPARYVLELSAGTVDALGITRADMLMLPPQLIPE